LFEADALDEQRLPRTNDDLPLRRIESDDEQRLARRDAKTPALTDRVMDDARMRPHQRSVDMNDLAGFGRAGAQAFDDRSVFPLRHEADVLTVRLVGDDETEIAGDAAHFIFRQIAQRKTQIVELRARR